MIRTDDLVVIEKKAEALFTLEVSKDGELTLVNHVKNYVYKPAEQTYNVSSLKYLFQSQQNISFNIVDMFNLVEPEVTVNSETIRFVREKTRKELEEELDNFGAEQLSTNQLIKKLDQVEKKLEDKYNANNLVIGNSNLLFNEFSRKFEENFSLLEKEITLIKDFKFDDLGKLINTGKNEVKANEKSADSRPLSELDIQFQNIKGFKRYCVGKNNGCTYTGSLWGSNPYTTGDGDNYCRAALHCEVIDESGGVYEVKLIGQYPNFTASTKNGITSYDYSAYTGYSIHHVETDVDSKNYTSCTNI